MERLNSSDWTFEKEEKLKSKFPLHYACRDGDVDSLRSYLDDTYGDTGSSSKTGANNRTIAQQEDCFYGWTPAHWAAYFGKLACLRKLSCYNRPVNLRCDMRNSKFHQTPSHLAAYAGHPHCLQWLLQSEANINAEDYLGETPLHKAARTGSMECVSLLVSYRASLGIKNYKGQTPSVLARSCGLQECAHYLETSIGNYSSEDNNHSGGVDLLDSRMVQQRSSDDILMDKAVMNNCKLVGGRKRCLEDLEEGIFKKLRESESDDSSHLADNCITSSTDISVLDSFNAVLSVSTEPLQCDSNSFNDLPDRQRVYIRGIFL